ncbi:Ig-like domain-containing protein (plasmid) [Nitratireductor sp. GISD-1A_MAKvit]|uniref:Ig-like domain-containing protein n=1 Tax=Nitratireductor sp. GISD-1A_MAKvit TaxID=3234198 RepID=UPI00346714BF
MDLRVYVSDGTTTISDDFRFVVRGVNDAPVLDAPLDDVAQDENGETIKTSTAFRFAAQTGNFSDPDGDQLAFSAMLADGQALPDWLQFDGASFSGTAPAGASGVYEIELKATDGAEIVSDIFTLTVEQGNAAPVVVDDGIFRVYQPGVLSIDVATLLANDSDADGDTLEITGVQSGTGGSARLENGKVYYDPIEGFDGLDQFIYTVSDGKTEATGRVFVAVDNSYGDYEHQGTEGNDTLFGGFGSGSVFGGAGDDRLFSGLFGGDVAGGEGDDLVVGLLGGGTLDGNEGDDRIIGGLGRDIISGGTGNDRLTGGWGSDVFVFNTGDGQDTITDFSTGRQRFFIPGDEIRLNVDGVDDFADLMALAEQRSDGVLFDFGNGDELFLSGTQLAALDSDSFTFY